MPHIDSPRCIIHHCLDILGQCIPGIHVRQVIAEPGRNPGRNIPVLSNLGKAQVKHLAHGSHFASVNSSCLQCQVQLLPREIRRRSSNIVQYLGTNASAPELHPLQGSSVLNREPGVHVIAADGVETYSCHVIKVLLCIGRTQDFK